MGQHIFKIHVIPNSNKFEIIGYDPLKDVIKIRVRSKPERGKANKELLYELRKLLGHEVMIKSGQKKRDKIIVVFCENNELQEVKEKLKLDEKGR